MNMTEILTPERAISDATAALEAAGLRGTLASWDVRDGTIATEVTVRRCSDKHDVLTALLPLPGGVLCSDPDGRGKTVTVWRLREAA